MYTALIVVGSIWILFHGIVAYLKRSARYREGFLRFLDENSIFIGCCYVRWYSTRFNRMITRWATFRPTLQRIWFDIGIVVSLCCSCFSVVLLFTLVWNTLSQKQSASEQVLVPVLPGVNLPLSHAFYYVVTVLIAAVVHELGHAIAACREQVRLSGVGLFLFFVYPGAYCDIQVDLLVSGGQLDTYSQLRKQLRVYCAGIWHNVVLCGGACALLFSLSYVLLPLYAIGVGVVVTDITQTSVLNGPSGLLVGDHIVGVNECPIRSISDWDACLRQAKAHAAAGYCVPQRLMAASGPAPVSTSLPCCDATLENTHLCFSDASSVARHCLAARRVSSYRECSQKTDCSADGDANANGECLTPIFENNATRLLRVRFFAFADVSIKRPGSEPVAEADEPDGSNEKTDLLYLGSPVELHASVFLSDFVPRVPYLSLTLPTSLILLSMYAASFSAAFALLNSVPCYALDGQYVLLALCNALLARAASRRTCTFIYFGALAVGTLLLCTSVLFALTYLFLG